MSASTALVLHRGAREVSREELVKIVTPEHTKTWKPVGHDRVLDTSLSWIKEAGFSVKSIRLAVSQDNARFFATLDLTTTLDSSGLVTLAVGVRNSIDKTFPMGFAAGSRVFVCDNLSFHSELMVRRKHTINGVARFSQDIAEATLKLNSFREGEIKRIGVMQATELTNERADSLILRSAVDRGIITLREIPHVVHQWTESAHPEFHPRTAWSLFNAFTEVLKRLQTSNPTDLATKTMRLSAMLA